MEEIENALPNVNDMYDPNTIIATINSITDANQFCNTYNHNNRYNGLKLGQKIKINDGAYNINWLIAGVDYEADNIADDGSPNNNGYGICLIPESVPIRLVQWDSRAPWNSVDFNDMMHIPYINSTIRTNALRSIGNNLKNVLGDHLINRNVLLGSSVSNSLYQGTISYTWTKDYCTLMSPLQIIGENCYKKHSGDNFSMVSNNYDNGEANYKLPLFNYMKLNTYIHRDVFDADIWLRAYAGVYDYISSGKTYYSETAWKLASNGNLFITLSYYDTAGKTTACPMIYIR